MNWDTFVDVWAFFGCLVLGFGYGFGATMLCAWVEKRYDNFGAAVIIGVLAVALFVATFAGLLS